MPTILFADDNRESRHLMARLLPHFGYDLVTVRDGLAAVEAVAARPFDLILLDINMPYMNGVEVCREIKRMDDRSHIPVIFISGNYLPEMIEDLHTAGGFAFITKPFEIGELDKALKEALSPVAVGT